MTRITETTLSTYYQFNQYNENNTDEHYEEYIRDAMLADDDDEVLEMARALREAVEANEED